MRTNWHIRGAKSVCSASGREFTDGEVIFTALFDDEEDGFVRRDYCAEVWADEAERVELMAFSHWKSRYEKPQEKAPEPVAVEDAESQLRQGARADADGKGLFLLALFLERKRVLKLQAIEEAAGGVHRVRIYEHKKSGEIFVVRDWQLTADEIDDELEADFANLLPQKGLVRSGSRAEEVAG